MAACLDRDPKCHMGGFQKLPFVGVHIVRTKPEPDPRTAYSASKEVGR